MRPVPVPARTRTAVRTAASVLLAVAALGACSSEELDVEGFAPGPCTALAPALQDVDAALRGLDDEEASAQQAGEAFEAAQDELKAAAGPAQDPVAESVTELVTRLGFFRIAVDTGTYDGSQDAAVRTAVDVVAEDCRTS